MPPSRSQPRAQAVTKSVGKEDGAPIKDGRSGTACLVDLDRLANTGAEGRTTRKIIRIFVDHIRIRFRSQTGAILNRAQSGGARRSAAIPPGAQKRRRRRDFPLFAEPPVEEVQPRVMALIGGAAQGVTRRGRPMAEVARPGHGGAPACRSRPRRSQPRGLQPPVQIRAEPGGMDRLVDVSAAGRTASAKGRRGPCRVGSPSKVISAPVLQDRRQAPALSAGMERRSPRSANAQAGAEELLHVDAEMRRNRNRNRNRLRPQRREIHPSAEPTKRGSPDRDEPRPQAEETSAKPAARSLSIRSWS